jgi:hypothetical protein
MDQCFVNAHPMALIELTESFPIQNGSQLLGNGDILNR